MKGWNIWFPIKRFSQHQCLDGFPPCGDKDCDPGPFGSWPSQDLFPTLKIRLIQRTRFLNHIQWGWGMDTGQPTRGESVRDTSAYFSPICFLHLIYYWKIEKSVWLDSKDLPSSCFLLISVPNIIFFHFVHFHEHWLRFYLSPILFNKPTHGFVTGD